MNRAHDSKTFSRNLESKLLLARIENSELKKQVSNLQKQVDVAEAERQTWEGYACFLANVLRVKFA